MLYPTKFDNISISLSNGAWKRNFNAYFMLNLKLYTDHFMYCMNFFSLSLRPLITFYLIWIFTFAFILSFRISFICCNLSKSNILKNMLLRALCLTIIHIKIWKDVIHIFNVESTITEKIKIGSIPSDTSFYNFQITTEFTLYIKRLTAGRPITSQMCHENPLCHTKISNS